MTTILVTGRYGQLGWELERTLPSIGRVFAVDRDVLDLTDATATRDLLERIKPDIIVNPAAYTAVDKAETDRASAQALNVEAPKVLANWAAQHRALMVHFSTDYVFDGEKASPYKESDSPNPCNVYGESKLAGEEAVKNSGCDYLLLRTSWLFTSRGRNFLLTMLRLGEERDTLSIVDDQIGAPTSACYFAGATAHIIRQALSERRSDAFESGLYHLTACDETSWHGFARAILASAKLLPSAPHLRTKRIDPIPSSAYPTPAKRPKNSRLDCSKVQERFGIVQQPWEDGMRLCLEELYGNG